MVKHNINPNTINEEQFIQYYGRIIFKQFTRFVENEQYLYGKPTMPYIKVKFYSKTKNKELIPIVPVKLDSTIIWSKGTITTKSERKNLSKKQRKSHRRVRNESQASPEDMKVIKNLDIHRSRVHKVDMIQVKHMPIVTQTVETNCYLDFARSDSSIGTDSSDLISYLDSSTQTKSVSIGEPYSDHYDPPMIIPRKLTDLIQYICDYDVRQESIHYDPRPIQKLTAEMPKSKFLTDSSKLHEDEFEPAEEDDYRDMYMVEIEHEEDIFDDESFYDDDDYNDDDDYG